MFKGIGALFGVLLRRGAKAASGAVSSAGADVLTAAAFFDNAEDNGGKKQGDNARNDNGQ